MALHITNESVEEMAKSLASVTGESVAEAIAHAVEERLARVSPKKITTVAGIQALVRSFNIERPDNSLSEDEILGYGPNGYCE